MVRLAVAVEKEETTAEPIRYLSSCNVETLMGSMERFSASIRSQSMFQRLDETTVISSTFPWNTSRDLEPPQLMASPAVWSRELCSQEKGPGSSSGCYQGNARWQDPGTPPHGTETDSPRLDPPALFSLHCAGWWSNRWVVSSSHEKRCGMQVQQYWKRNNCWPMHAWNTSWLENRHLPFLLKMCSLIQELVFHEKEVRNLATLFRRFLTFFFFLSSYKKKGPRARF